MKQKDLALVLVMIFVGAAVAFAISRWIFASPQNRGQTAEVVDVIGPEFSLPSSRYFNAESVNPTQLIEIGDSNNPNPFNASAQ
jgi:hypothetical protein